MAKVFYGPNVVGMSGSFKNVVYSNWRGKGYVRTRALVVDNPQTADQTRQREAIAEASKEWYRDLTPEQRALWMELAEQIGSEYDQETQSLGGQGIITPGGKNMTGYNAFIRTVLERESIGYGHKEHKVKDAPKGYNPPEPPSGLAVTYNLEEDCFEVSMYAPLTPGTPYEYEDDLLGTIVQPTMIRLWIDPPGAPARIHTLIPIVEPGGIVFATVLNLKILGEEVPLYPGAYRFQADAVTGRGLRSGPSNQVTALKPLCCAFNQLTILNAIWNPAGPFHVIEFEKTLVDDVCYADFLKVFLVATTAVGVDIQMLLFPRSSWGEGGPGNYAVRFQVEPPDVAGVYTWKIKPGNYCGALAVLSASDNTTIPA